MNQEVLEQLRMAEVKNALGIVSADVAARVAKCLPGFFDTIKQSMPARRASLAAGLKALAKELEREAEAILGERVQSSGTS